MTTTNFKLNPLSSSKRRLSTSRPSRSSRLPLPRGIHWPLVFRDGKPLPSDSSIDGIITIYNGAGVATQYIDPTTRMAIDAVTHKPLGVRRDISEIDDSGV